MFNKAFSDLSMASSTGELTFGDPDITEAWLRCFAASARSKKLKDEPTKSELPVTDLFLAKAGVDAVRRVSIMAHPKELEEMPFNEIRKVILETVRPQKKLVIAERVQFLSLKQNVNECVQSFVERLRQAARYCEFEKLGENDQTAEDDLIQMTLIDGLSHSEQRIKTLEFLQAGNPKLGACVDFIRQLELIGKFSQTNLTTDRGEGMNEQSVSHVDKNKFKNLKCKFCGYSHTTGKCPAFGKTCGNCGKKNHFQAVCRSATKKVDEVEKEETASVFTVKTLKGSSLTTVKLHKHDFQMQVDTGSEVTLIPRNFWNTMGQPRLKRCDLKLKQFDGSNIKLLGKFESTIESPKLISLTEIIVADCEKDHGLIGMDVLPVDATSIVNSIQAKEVGRLEGFKANILLKNNAQPTYFEARQVPIHMKPQIVKKLTDLLNQGLLERVPPGGSKWASPIVVVKKKDGDLRVCADYKVGVNGRICSDSYPTPSIELALHKLQGSTHFAKIDLKGAYNQIEMAEEAREITTINTPLGLLRWTCLPYGIKTASAIFQRAIEATIGNDNDNLVIYQDDICIGAKSKEDLQKKLGEILSKLKNAGMKINKEKCIMEATELSFLGYRISAKGVSPDKALVQKILDMKEPTNKKELASFIGLVNFYGRFIPNFSDRLSPLLELRKSKEPFTWNETHKRSFDELKHNLTTSPVVQLYDSKKDLTLTTDASEHSISAVLSQENHPILFLSRTLSNAERNYSNIEREALAIVWATSRARQFLLGRHFNLITDHKPLEFIFHGEKSLPKVTSARIMRWALQLSAFDYTILYAKGENIPHVDALSRLKFKSSDNECALESSCVHLVETDVLQPSELQRETPQDPVLKDILKRIRTNNWSNCSIAERSYKCVRQELTIEKGIILRGDVPVIPASMRSKIIAAVHNDTHNGVRTSRNRIRLEAWWPGYTDDVELFIRRCNKCSKIKPAKATDCHKWPQEDKPWVRVHMDHAYEQNIGIILILVDSFSGWPEVIRVKDRSAETVKHVLRTVFARNGVPHTLVSDNAREFLDESLCSWLKRIGCNPLKTPPYHPQSNGLAERMVSTVKLGLKAFSPSLGSVDAYLARMLLSYRSIPHGDRNASPSALMGRQIRSPITLSFQTGEKIWFRAKPSAIPEPATFISQAGNNTAIVIRGNQGTLAHTDQINLKHEEHADLSETEDKLDKDNTIKRDRNIWSDFLSNQTPLNETLSDEDNLDEFCSNAQAETILRRSTRTTRGQKPSRFT